MVMRKHQRYFPVFSAAHPDQLLPHFITVANGQARRAASRRWMRSCHMQSCSCSWTHRRRWSWHWRWRAAQLCALAGVLWLVAPGPAGSPASPAPCPAPAPQVDAAQVAAGNEAVLRARFEDATFFYKCAARRRLPARLGPARRGLGLLGAACARPLRWPTGLPAACSRALRCWFECGASCNPAAQLT
jgi:hypothetical protein